MSKQNSHGMLRVESYIEPEVLQWIDAKAVKEDRSRMAQVRRILTEAMKWETSLPLTMAISGESIKEARLVMGEKRHM